MNRHLRLNSLVHIQGSCAIRDALRNPRHPQGVRWCDAKRAEDQCHPGTAAEGQARMPQGTSKGIRQGQED